MVVAEMAAVLSIVSTVKEAIERAVVQKYSTNEKEREIKIALAKVLKRFKLDYEQFEAHRQADFFGDFNELMKKYREPLLTIIFEIEGLVSEEIASKLKTLTSSMQNAINVMPSLPSQTRESRQEKRQAGNNIISDCDKIIELLEKK